MTIGERMRQFVELTFDSITAFERTMDAGGFHKYFKSERLPGSGILMKMRDLGCNVDWLMSGEGPMFADNQRGRELRLQFAEAAVGQINAVAEPTAEYRLPMMLAPFRPDESKGRESKIESMMNLTEYLLPFPGSSFLIRVMGENMSSAGIHYGDLLVVDSSLEPQSGDVVVVTVKGEMLVKRYERVGDRKLLFSDNQSPYTPLDITTMKKKEANIMGVVRSIIHKLPGK